MIVCHCFGVNDRRINELADQAVASAAEVRSLCGAGGDCGSCVSTIRHLLQRRTETAVDLL